MLFFVAAVTPSCETIIQILDAAAQVDNNNSNDDNNNNDDQNNSDDDGSTSKGKGQG